MHQWKITRDAVSGGGSIYLGLVRGNETLKVRISSHPFTPNAKYHDSTVQKFSLLIDEHEDRLNDLLSVIRHGDSPNMDMMRVSRPADLPTRSDVAARQFRLVDAPDVSGVSIASYVLLAVSPDQLVGLRQAATQRQAIEINDVAKPNHEVLSAMLPLRATHHVMALFCDINLLLSQSFHLCVVTMSARITAVDPLLSALTAADVCLLDRHRISELSRLDDPGLVPVAPCTIQRPSWA